MVDLKLGIMIEGQEGLTWERWRGIAERVERLGFESLWRSDHLFSLFGPKDRPALETWVSLVWLAQNTRRIRFGPLVCPMTFRHPSMLAKMAAAVDELSGGRLELGVGAGWNEGEHRAFGIPFPPIRDRMDMLEQGIQVILALWRDEPANFRGGFYSLENAVSYPKPAQQPQPPLIVGGGGERRTLRIAARFADEWNGTGLRPAAYRAKLDVLLSHCTAVGRDPSTLRYSWMGAFVIGENERALIARARRLQELMPPLATVAKPDALLVTLRDRGWIVGTPAEAADQMAALADAGAQRLMLQMHDQEDLEVLDLISSEVMPLLANT